MDIHRCRFVPYPASAINALAFSHPSSLIETGYGPPTLRLALARANGDIEIWNPLKGAWIQETILRGGKDRSIEGLAWTHDLDGEGPDGKKIAGKLRLFSIGYSTVITEWDLFLGRPIRHSGGNYGEIWCLAAQPRWKDQPEASTKKVEGKQDQNLLVGCADGTLVLHSTADGDLKYLRTFARPTGKKSRVLCIAFQRRGVVVAGYADSTIRVYAVNTGRHISSMSLGAGPSGGPSEILVWSLKCLPNGNIVSGDSSGEIRFWDGQNFTLLQRIKSHKADILDLAINVDGSTVLSGGMDRRTTFYRQVGGSDKGKRGRWIEVSHQRYHSHDVKTMATYESKDMSVVASGGLDCTPIIIPFREFGRENVRRLPVFPHSPSVESAPGKRLLMSWWDRHVSIWRIGNQLTINQENGESFEPMSRKLVAKIMAQGDENLSAVSLAPSGEMLVLSTAREVKAFLLRNRYSSVGDTVRVQKAVVPLNLASHGAKLVQFSPDSRWVLVVRMDNTIHVHRVIRRPSSEKKVKISKLSFELQRRSKNYSLPNPHHGSHGSYSSAISTSAWSSDSRILVVGDLAGHLDSWMLEGHEDVALDDDEAADQQSISIPSEDEDDEAAAKLTRPIVIYGQHWIRNPNAPKLPKLPSSPLILSFRPATPASSAALTNKSVTVHPTRHNPHPHTHDLPHGEGRLFVLTSQHQAYEYDTLTGRLSDWSRRNPPTSLPKNFKRILDRAMGLLWDTNSGRERIWLYGSSWLWMLDLRRDLQIVDESPLETVPGADDIVKDTPSSRKRKREPGETRSTKKTSGAGGQKPDNELDLGIGSGMWKSTGSDVDGNSLFRFEPERSGETTDDNDDSDVGMEGNSDLIELRRAPRTDVVANSDLSNGTVADEEPATNGDTTVAQMELHQGPSYWHTYKYRPILGIVPLGIRDDTADRTMAGGGVGDESSLGIEVAVVERPLWDVDLPPRYYGDQEWEK